MKFRVGVIGATGYIGTPYRAEIRESGDDAEIVALCARRQGPLEAAAREDGCEFITDDWRKVVDHPDVNLVVVAIPDALHYETVMASARKGRHVVCDKPIAANVGEAYEMWSAYRDAGLAHYVPFWTRYEPAFARAKTIVEEGTLGEIKALFFRWHNPRPDGMPFTWRDDATLSASGSIADIGSHSYDTVRWILGSEARRVLAHADVITSAKPDLGAVNLDEALEWGESHIAADSKKLRRGTAYDYATILWEFQNGAVGSITVSHAPYLRKGLAPDLEIHGTDASMAIDRINNTIGIVRPGETSAKIEAVDNPGPVNRFSHYVFPALRERASGAESEHPGLHDGWRVQILCDAAALSAQRGTWVELSELDAE